MTKKILKGIVKSTKSDKTIVVEVTRKFKHPFMKKLLKDQKNIMLTMKTISLRREKRFKFLSLNQFLRKKHGR